MGHLQHVVVIAVNGDVGVHIAITRMHVQGYPNTPLQHPLVNGVKLFQNRRKCRTHKQGAQGCLQLGLPTRAQAVVLQLWEEVIHAIKPRLPLATHLGHQRKRLRHATIQNVTDLKVRRFVGFAQWQHRLTNEGRQGVTQRQLVLHRQFNVDALNAFGVFTHTLERNDHVLVDLERICVLADRRRAFAIQPKFLTGLWANRHKALAAAPVS